MSGLWLLYDSSAKPLREDLVARFSAWAKQDCCSQADYAPAPCLWVRNVHHPVTDAPGGAVKSPGGSVEVVLHGEVYNSPELAAHLGAEHAARKTIVEGPQLVAAGIEREGMRFVARVNGSFVLVAWFPREQRLVLANDRFGLRPHYRGWDDQVLMLAPRVQPVHRSWRRSTELNLRGTAEFFAFQYPMDNRTHVDGIDTLPPGTVLAVEGGRFRTTQYWDFPYPDKPLDGTEEELCGELVRLLAVAVKRRLLSRCALGVPLSGGLDSRTLAALAARETHHLDTFTFGPDDGLERKYARLAAERLGAINHTAASENVPWQDNFLTSVRECDGMSPVLHGSIVLLLPLIRQHVGVVLDGLSGDFILGSGVAPNMLAGHVRPGFAKWLFARRYCSGFSVKELKDLFVREQHRLCRHTLMEPVVEKLRQCVSTRRADCADYVNFRQRQRRFIINGNTLLRTVAEVRTPFYDYDLIDYALSLPVSLRFKKYVYKQAMRRLFPELADIPYTPKGERLNDLPAVCPQVSHTRERIRQSMATQWGRLPSPVRVLLRALLRKGGLRSKIDYPVVFANHVAPMCAGYSDSARGWRELTDYGVIERIIRDLRSADRSRTMKASLKLSVWITFQMYREQAGLGSV